MGNACTCADPEIGTATIELKPQQKNAERPNGLQMEIFGMLS